MVDLSIVIVSYNTREFLRDCLCSLENGEKSLTSEIIIVDNVSTDDTDKMIENEFSNIIFLQNKKNLGFSKANNIGIKESKGKYILFLNPDTAMEQDTLKTMIEFMDDNKEVGAATCRIELPNGKLDDACHRGFPTPWRAFCYFLGLSRIFPTSRIFAGYTMGWENLSKIHEVDSCSGAFMMVRRKAGEEIGWWDEDYFWYGEDLDFCYRLKEKDPSINSGQGWKVYFVPTVSILHYKGISGGIKQISNHLTTANKETRIRSTKARFEAMRIFYKKHYINKYPRFITWLVLQAINLKLKSALKNL